MPAQEVELVRNRALEPLAGVDVEVQARVVPDLYVALRAPGGGASGGGWGDGVTVGDRHQDRAAEFVHPGDRPVGPLGEDGSPGHLVPDRKSTRLNSSHLGIS